MNKGFLSFCKIISFIIKLSVCAIFVFPFYYMFSLSLQTMEEVTRFPPTLAPKIPQFVNFIKAWNSGPFALYLRNSVIIIISIMILQTIIMIPAAYAFAKYDFKFKNIFFTMVIISFMTPAQITFVPVYQMMAKWKLLDSLWAQIIPFITNTFGIFLLRQYFMQVPNELIEAARLDKAGELKIIFRILLPMSKAALSTIILFSFVGHWNEYFWPLILTNKVDVRPLTIGIATLKDVEGLANWNIVMAGNVLLVAPILLVYGFVTKNIIKTFAYTGIK